MLQYLFNNTWLDVYTRAIFIEFTVYNANVNLFCIVTLMLETTAVGKQKNPIILFKTQKAKLKRGCLYVVYVFTGAFQYSSKLQTLRLYETTDGINIVASEVIYFLFILYYMFLQVSSLFIVKNKNPQNQLSTVELNRKLIICLFEQIKKIKQEKLQYFRSKYNLLELAIILLSLAAVGAIINRTVQGNQELKYFQEHKDQ